MIAVEPLTEQHAEAAMAVWRAANVARGRAPGPAREERVRAKLTASGALGAVARDGDHAVGMALAEPGRADGGDGDPIAGLLHLSMVFVAPDRQGEGIGAALVRWLLEQGAAAGYDTASVWTGATNHRALALYQRAGFARTDERQHLDDLGAVVRLQGTLGS